MKIISAVLAAACVSGPAFAQQELILTMKASELGSVLASEEMCGLKYKQPAIEQWIADNVPADAISFAGALDMAVMGGKYGYKDQTESERTAHCAAIKKTAKHFGFID